LALKKPAAGADFCWRFVISEAKPRQSTVRRGRMFLRFVLGSSPRRKRFFFCDFVVSEPKARLRRTDFFWRFVFSSLKARPEFFRRFAVSEAKPRPLADFFFLQFCTLRGEAEAGRKLFGVLYSQRRSRGFFLAFCTQKRQTLRKRNVSNSTNIKKSISNSTNLKKTKREQIRLKGGAGRKENAKRCENATFQIFHKSHTSYDSHLATQAALT
jgi:hypothetical protein